MKKSKSKTPRLTKSKKVLMFVETNTCPAKNRTIGIPGLYVAYRKHIIRFANPVSKERFVQILDKNGYRRNGGLMNGLLMDLDYERGY